MFWGLVLAFCARSDGRQPNSRTSVIAWGTVLSQEDHGTDPVWLTVRLLCGSLYFVGRLFGSPDGWYYTTTKAVYQ